jgi:hypothetical protein
MSITAAVLFPIGMIAVALIIAAFASPSSGSNGLDFDDN